MKKFGFAVFALVLLGFVFFKPTTSYAYDRWHGHDHGRYHGGHRSSVSLNFGYWPQRYYYYPAREYVYVAPTTTYYEPAPQVTTIVASPEVADSGVYEINVPNTNGGFTAITIKKSGNGYVGPQGEFYTEFPKVAQLKAMYAK